MKGYEHVHFTELANGRPVNPLAPGHMGPYGESSAPELDSVSFRVGESAREALPESVSGRIVPVVRVQDRPARPVPGVWANLPVAPALIVWRVERAENPADRDPAARRARRPHLDPREPRLLDRTTRAAAGRTRRPSASSGHGGRRARTSTGSRARRSTRAGFRTASTGSWSPRPTSAATAARWSRSSSSGTGRARECQTRSRSDRSPRRPGRRRLRRSGARAAGRARPAAARRHGVPRRRPSRRDGDERRLGVLRADAPGRPADALHAALRPVREGRLRRSRAPLEAAPRLG